MDRDDALHRLDWGQADFSAVQDRGGGVVGLASEPDGNHLGVADSCGELVGGLHHLAVGHEHLAGDDARRLLRWQDGECGFGGGCEFC